MLKVRTLAVGQLSTNCYLVLDDKTRLGLIVDPGDDADYIQRIIADEDMKPTQIIATHGHFDHILAATELRLAYKIPFLMNKNDEFMLKHMSKSAQYFCGISSDPSPEIDHYLDKNETVEIGNWSLDILTTSGHTPGSISIYSQEHSFIFVGDTLFAGGGVGRTDFFYSKRKDLEKSIKKLLTLPADTIIYSGHGEKSKVAFEKKFHR